jgi:hypothetical protein
MKSLLRWLGLLPPPDPRAAAFDAMSTLVLDELRRNPEARARVAKMCRDAGLSIEEAREGFARFGRGGHLTTRRESVS